MKKKKKKNRNGKEGKDVTVTRYEIKCIVRKELLDGKRGCCWKKIRGFRAKAKQGSLTCDGFFKALKFLLLHVDAPALFYLKKKKKEKVKKKTKKNEYIYPPLSSLLHKSG